MPCICTNAAAAHIPELDLISFIILIKICPFNVDKEYIWFFLLSPLVGTSLIYSLPLLFEYKMILLCLRSQLVLIGGIMLGGSGKRRTWSLAWGVGQVTRGLFPVASCLPCVLPLCVLLHDSSWMCRAQTDWHLWNHEQSKAFFLVTWFSRVCSYSNDKTNTLA